jgi:hypothetical protein
MILIEFYCQVHRLSGSKKERKFIYPLLLTAEVWSEQIVQRNTAYIIIIPPSTWSDFPSKDTFVMKSQILRQHNLLHGLPIFHIFIVLCSALHRQWSVPVHNGYILLAFKPFILINPAILWWIRKGIEGRLWMRQREFFLLSFNFIRP